MLISSSSSIDFISSLSLVFSSTFTSSIFNASSLTFAAKSAPKLDDVFGSEEVSDETIGVETEGE